MSWLTVSHSRLTYLFLKAHSKAKHDREVRQFWKLCRDRGVRDADAVRELRSGTLEFESPMVSYLRVAEYHESLAKGHTATQQWRSTIVLCRNGTRGRFLNNFSRPEPSYPRYPILPEMPGNELAGKKFRGRASDGIFATIFATEQAPESQMVDFAISAVRI